MRNFVALLVSIVAAQWVSGGELPSPPNAVPQAVQALRHLIANADSGPTSWTNGPYGYDGAGNITAIGAETFAYDKLGRLETAIVRGPDMSNLQTQAFDYDTYGNLISTVKLGQTIPLPTSTTTNQLNALMYDASGHVTSSGSLRYDYDALGMLNTVRLGTGAQPRIVYAYTADDERLFSFDVAAGVTRWTLRGFDNKVLRDYRQEGSTWSVERDYVYRDDVLLAAIKPGGAMEHYSLDHLGTPRLITDGSGHKIGYHVYWPFGQEWSSGSTQDGSPMQFTGHERDTDPSGGPAPLDYMHARYYSSSTGRFLAADSALNVDAALREPQLWNRYSYARNNPASYIDADGKQFAPGQHYVIGQGWTARSVLDPANRPTPQMVAQYITITASLLPMPGGNLLGKILGRAGTFALERLGFSAAERGVMGAATKILQTGGADLIKAFEAGEAKELTIAGQKIIVQPDAPISGMTLHGEKAFVLGREAFKSNAELAKTVLHEMYRLAFQEGTAASGASATASTKAAATFAESAYEVVKPTF